MAAGNWSVYDGFQQNVGLGNIDLSAAWGAATGFNWHLFRGSSNAATSTLSTLGSLTSQVLSTNGYTLSGKSVASNTWASVATGQMEWDATDPVFTATGGTISAIQFAVLVATTGTSTKDGANLLVARNTLSASPFDLNDGSTLTLQLNANGIFRMSSAD